MQRNTRQAQRQRRSTYRVTQQNNTDPLKKLSKVSAEAVRNRANCCIGCPKLVNFHVTQCANWPSDPGQAKVQLQCQAVEFGKPIIKPPKGNPTDFDECSHYRREQNRRREQSRLVKSGSV
jgi:hypothetical protein